jgi:signal transduction histidine kinase/ActR/RegA family two-component response regulator
LLIVLAPLMKTHDFGTRDFDHVVHFYEADASLSDALMGFIGDGLAAGEAGIVIATPEHRAELERRLLAAGIDLDAARAASAYVALDAAETLARLVVDGIPDPERFRELVGGEVARAARGGRRLRVFGEMVGLLLSNGHASATIRLEELWNELGQTHPFRLFCAYPLGALGRGLAHPIVEVCARHSRVIPAGSRTADAATSERVGELEAQVQDLRRLHETSVRLTSLRDVDAVLREVLQAAMAVPETGLGLLSLGDPERPGLRLGVHAGLDEEFLRHVEAVPPGEGACGTAYTERRRVVVEDVEVDPIYAPHRDAARKAGFRSCHSTPLISRRGDTVGVLSLLFVEPHRPSDRETRLLDLYAQIAADSIENARLQQRLQQQLEDRRQSLAREHTARADAEMANRMKDEFLATVSHELRTPLNAILGWAHILRGGKLDETTIARGIEVIERNAQTQAQLIEDILDASRVITGSLRLNRGAVDLAAVINAAIESVRLGAEAKGLQLAVILDPAARYLTGDASRLQQVVWNLLANAIKFTASGGRVEARLDRVDGQARIKVTDTGEGVPAEFLPFIFDRFRQADSTITRRHGGLGLGLAIVRHLVELHSGTVQAESAGEGYGSSFIVWLPLAEHPASDRIAPASSDERRPALRGMQILLVDDDQDALDIMTLVLTEAGAAVRTAASATEAMALLRWIQPDVLVSDLAMPDEDGYSLIRNLRAIERVSGRETPAVALTAYVRVQDRARAVAAGFNVFVEKPVDPEELIAVLVGITESRAGRSAAASDARHN